MTNHLLEKIQANKTNQKKNHIITNLTYKRSNILFIQNEMDPKMHEYSVNAQNVFETQQSCLNCHNVVHVIQISITSFYLSIQF